MSEVWARNVGKLGGIPMSCGELGLAPPTAATVVRGLTPVMPEVPALGYNGVGARPPGGGWRKSLAGQPREIVPNITE